MGLFVKIVDEKKTDGDNLVFIFAKSQDAFEKYLSDKLLALSINENNIRVDDAHVLTDRRPVLNYLNRYASLSIRQGN